MLAPTARMKMATTDGLWEFHEEDCFLAKEQMARASTLVQANSLSSVLRVHGVEDFMGSRFCALGQESESESDDDDSKRF